MSVSESRPVVGLLLACHPWPTVAVTTLVTALAAATGRPVRGCAAVGAAVLAGQLSIGWCNDAVDAGRDRSNAKPDKPAAGGLVAPHRVDRAARMALVACVPLSYASGVAAGSVHLVGVGAGWAYDLGVKGTRWSWVPYAVGFASLPAFVTLGLPGSPPPRARVVAAAALIGCGAHVADVLPDLADDRATGVRGGPHRLGARGIRAAAPLPPLAATALLGCDGARIDRAGRIALAGAGAVTLAGAVLGGRWSKAPFAAVVAVAAIDVALLLARGESIAAAAPDRGTDAGNARRSGLMHAVFGCREKRSMV